MKSIWKIFPASAVAAVVVAACAPEEKLDLAGYPQTQVGINLADLRTPAPTLTLTALYNSQGMLELDGELSHDYLIRISEPNSQDMTLTLEAVCVNIPADKVVLSPTEYTLKAGEIDIPVSVTFTDTDFNFAAPNKDAETYEIGVKIAGVQGNNISATMWGCEAKVVIEKEAYSANISLGGATGRSVSFTRAYWDGVILETEPMSYDFTVTLDKPASEDVTVTFSMEGLGAAFSGDWSVTPSSVVIPAGSLVSGTATWTLDDDFLLTTDLPENHALVLAASFQSADPYVAFAADGGGEITFDIAKVYDALEVLTPNAVPSGWTELSTTGWVLSGVSNAARLFDGNTGTGSTNYLSFTGTTGITVDVDMQAAKTLKGFTIRATQNTYNVTIVELLISDDGVTYTSVGVKSGLTRPTTYYTIGLKAPLTTRYIRFVLKDTTGTKRLNEIDIFGT